MAFFIFSPLHTIKTILGHYPQLISSEESGLLRTVARQLRVQLIFKFSIWIFWAGRNRRLGFKTSRYIEAQLCVRPAQRLGFLIGAQREFCRAWPNQSAVIVKGTHVLPENSPETVGSATASFVAKVLAGQIS
jgi:hypothetical protein